MGYKIFRYGWLPDLPDYGDHYFCGAPVAGRGGSVRFYAGLTDENLASDFWTIRIVQ